MELLNSLSAAAGVHPAILALVVVWSLAWKGVALWRAAALRQKYWFGIILVVNTLGILEIIYLLATRNKSTS